MISDIQASSTTVSAMKEQDPRILSFGEPKINASFQAQSYRNVLLHPTGGETSFRSAGQTSSFKYLGGSGNAMALSRSYLEVGIQITDQSGIGLGPDELNQCLVNLNTCALFQSANLQLSSVLLESVANIPAVTQYKLSKMSANAIKTTMSDVFLGQPDDYESGFPSIPQASPGFSGTETDNGGFALSNNDLWQKKRESGQALPVIDKTVTFQEGAGLIPSRPMPAVLRSQLFSNIIRWGNSGDNVTQRATPTIYKKIPLSMLFGFCEEQLLLPNSLLQIDLVRSQDTQMIVPISGQVEQPKVSVVDLKLNLITAPLSEEATKHFKNDKTIMVPHYKAILETIGASGMNANVQSYSGIMEIGIRMQASGSKTATISDTQGLETTGRPTTVSWVCPWQSTMPSERLNVHMTYRSVPLPVLNEPITCDIKALDITALSDDVVPKSYGSLFVTSPPESANSAMFFEMFQSSRSICDQLSPNEGAIGTGFLTNVNTWYKSNFTLSLPVTEDGSYNVDSEAAPINLSITRDGRAVWGDHSAWVIVKRTNTLKYNAADNSYVLTTNGPS